MSIEERFPVIDVTHKSKRTQRDNVLKAKGEIEDCSLEKVDDEEIGRASCRERV